MLTTLTICNLLRSHGSTLNHILHLTTALASQPLRVHGAPIAEPRIRSPSARMEIWVIKAILQAFLPRLALIVFLTLSPILLLKLSQAEGIPVQSHVVRGAARKYFYFSVFNVFLGVTIAGSLFDTLNDLINNPKLIISLLSKSL
ncbi:hypothetical protein L7F22_051834 [Adiantum nelumboides]|nr:hypothetical protein [Adiantum nelumboides]